MLQPGVDAPEFSVNDHNGNKINFYGNSRVILK